MEQLKEKAIQTTYKLESNEYRSECFPQNRILFNLKNHRVVQESLINTLLIRNNCLIDDIACILHINAEKLHRVWQGEDELTEKESFKLISLFYSLFN